MHGWTWQIRGKGIINQTEPAIGYSKRIEAEKAAIEEMLKLFESSL
jgi:hypothetical protein